MVCLYALNMDLNKTLVADVNNLLKNGCICKSKYKDIIINSVKL